MRKACLENGYQGERRAGWVFWAAVAGRVRDIRDTVRSWASAAKAASKGSLLIAALKCGRVLVALGLVPMLGCSPIENKARDTAAALSGSIVAAQTKYQASCAANPNQEICQLINRGVSGENALITAVETYCGWTLTLAPPDPTATCVPVKSAQAALEAAITDAASLTLEIKGAI